MEPLCTVVADDGVSLFGNPRREWSSMRYVRAGGPVVPWVVAASAGMVVHGVAAAADLQTVALVCKPVPVAVLALGVARRGDLPGSWLVAAALTVDAVADGVIEAVFLGGLGLFLVGHLLRVAVFTVDTPALRPLRAVPFLALAGHELRAATGSRAGGHGYLFDAEERRGNAEFRSEVRMGKRRRSGAALAATPA